MNQSGGEKHFLTHAFRELVQTAMFIAREQVDDSGARAVVPPQVLCDDHGVRL
jgi:hypothetical protein